MRKSKYKAVGSVRSTALTRAQFEYVVNGLIDRGDLRCAVICYLLKSPMRISDVLNLKVDHIWDAWGEPRKAIYLTEIKTGTKRSVPIWETGSEGVYTVLKAYRESIADRPKNGPAFISKKLKTPLSEEGFFWLLRDFVGQCNLEHISSHSFRKCCGSELFHTEGVQVEVLMKVYGHKNPISTMVYLGISAKEVMEAQLKNMW